MGKIKNGKIKNCQACGNEFYVPQYRIITAKFCSLICQNHKQYDKFKFTCQGCQKECETSPCRRKERKKFCSLQCRELKAMDDRKRRRLSKALQISKRGFVKARTLRSYISEFKEMKCEYCGYDEYVFCLDMHHIDHDPTNNNPENIGILCCICHRKLHKGVIEMPLIKGAKAKTKKGISENIKKEMQEGKKPKKQAIAIALNVARKSGAAIPKKKRKR